MKKIGIVIFVVALVIGLVVTSMFSFGRATGRLFNFSFNFSGVHGSGNLGSEKRSVSGLRLSKSAVFFRSRSPRKKISASRSRLTTTSCRS